MVTRVVTKNPTPATSHEPNNLMITNTRPAIALMASAAIAVALAALLILCPVKQCLVCLLDWARSLGAWGPAIVAAVYSLACLLLIPGSILTVAAGLLFGVPVGVLVTTTGANIGACSAFLVGRTIAREPIARKIAGSPKFAAIDEAVSRDGFKIVLLLRLSPILPFNILNYALGLTKVSFRDYALASLIGMLPEILVLVYFGSVARSLAGGITPAQVATPLEDPIFFWTGFALTLAVAVLVTRIAHRRLKTFQRN